MSLTVLVAGNPVDGVRHYGPFTHPEDADSFAESELRNQEWWAVELVTPFSGEGTDIGYEQVLEHLLQAHGEHLRTTTDPLSLGDFVTVNYVNPLYVRAKDRPQPIRFTD